MKDKVIDLTVEQTHTRIHYFDRPGSEATLLYVHGLGCASDDFRGMAEQPALSGYRLISYDMPGCGRSAYDASQPFNIERLVLLLDQFVRALDLKPFLLVGGSMGGLIGLLFAELHAEKITGFVNVEGNLRPEDCLFSRQVAGHDYPEFLNSVFPKILQALDARGNVGFSCHRSVLTQADPRAYFDNCPQLVEYSDHRQLLERFLALRKPRYFLYGSENRHLSYLPQLRQSDCTLLEIPQSNHFPFYDNPPAYASALASCL